MAIGTTDAGGNYTLTTYEPNDGAVIGSHTVTVKKLADAADAPAVPVGPMDRKQMAKAIEQSMRQSAQLARDAEKSRSGLPEKYAHLKTSDLHKEVVDGPNVIDLELTD